MTNIPGSAHALLTEAFLARVRRNDGLAAELEQQAQMMPDYSVRMHVAHLLAAANRHAQFNDDERYNRAMQLAWHLASSDFRSAILCIGATGSACAWRGQLADAYVWLAITLSFAQFLPPADKITVVSGIIPDAVMVVRLLTQSPDELSRLRALTS